MLEMELTWEGLDEAFDALEAELSEVVRGLSIEAWNLVLQGTPQFAGRMAASWTYSMGTPVFVDRSQAVEGNDLSNMPNYSTGFNAFGEEVFFGRQKGDPEAIGIANFANLNRDFGFKLGTTIFFANGVDHGEGGYSFDVENGGVFLRPENRPGNAVKRAMDKMGSMYSDEVRGGKAVALRTLRLGQ